MKLEKTARDSLLWLVSELHKETKLANAASMLGVKKHLERIGNLQLRLNGEIVKVLCYGE